MKNNKSIVLILSVLAVILLFGTSLAAIVMDDGGNPSMYTSVMGEDVELYGGAGLYQYDSVFKAVMFRGFDWLSLLVMVPLFGLGVNLFHRGKLRGQLLLASLFTYLAYIYLIGVMGNMFNVLFLAWTGLFSLGVFGLIFTLQGVNLPRLPEKLGARFPRKSVAIYVIALGFVLMIQYLIQVISSYGAGVPPAALEHYTTLELAALEIGIMVPLHWVGGVLLWRKQAWGYLMATLLAFAAATVFIALNTALLMLSLIYGQGTLADMVMPMLIMLIAGGFSIVIFSQGKGAEV
ncbi:MAG: hypothetical protein JEZ00_00865 [Anaerolineaceae bacterium]|nr:hypothetical protein [Anaerolineaceae bacterium]